MYSFHPCKHGSQNILISKVKNAFDSFLSGGCYSSCPPIDEKKIYANIKVGTAGRERDSLDRMLPMSFFF